jgi:IS30 family transposase
MSATDPLISGAMPPRFAAPAAAVLQERPPPVRLTLTWDQGSEMPGTTLLVRNFADGIYFAHPAGPWLHAPTRTLWV